MKLKEDDLKALCEIAVTAASEAGAMIQERVGTDVAIHDKLSGSSPASQIVTEVDLKSQEIILQHIEPTLAPYELGLLIEESDDDLSRFKKDYFWCVDPLDGTLPFVEGRPGYAVSIALVSREGSSCLGVVYDPLMRTLYSAIKGLGLWRNGELWDWQVEFEGSYKNLYSGGAVMNACQVLEKAPAYFVKHPKKQEGGGCLWDYAATACLFEEAGAVATDSYGQSLDLNSRESLFMNRRGVLYASHHEIVQELRD